jgi:nicotinate-nucleotide adenylyltransferase
MIRFGLFGGTFDPVHYGHLRPIEAARHELELPRVLILPNPQPPHKMREPLTPYAHRKEMLRLALAEFPHLVLADFEEQAVGPAYTTDTVRRVLASLPNEDRELWLIVGMDSLIELPLWKDPEELFRHARVAVLPRPGFAASDVRSDYFARARLLTTPLVDVSATEIRRRLRHGESIKDLLPETVIEYIRRNNLYS